MYIQDVHIQNIRSIADFQMHFDNPAGWHVIIGDNGAGKTTVARAIALGLLGGDIDSLRENLNNWIGKHSKENTGKVKLRILQDLRFDQTTDDKIPLSVPNEITIHKDNYHGGITSPRYADIMPEDYNWNGLLKGWFSCAFGSFRRLTSGNEEKEKIYKTHPRLGAHLSLFGEDVGLSEATKFLKELHIKNLEGESADGEYLDLLIKFINEGKLLPYGSQITKIRYENIWLRDGNGEEVTIWEMSDGFRSILSLTLELIRQLVRVYGLETVFEYVKKGENVIKTPGVVIIDEIDAHLHPTWQVKVGEWFLKYFPALQFIVTTHSPLICRASHTGTIWRLASPASDKPSGEVVGIDKDRLVYGNILDAYGTDVFGEGIERSEEGRKGLERLAYLNKKSIYDKQGLTAQEQAEYEKLKQIYQTDAIFDL
ncbi:MAG: hypothetical protein EAZ95_16025 [Bacteroidetes bacterium]|nr:MAG: hypothetical protein EAZ95_16025 [Bacteroidota bacterium]